MTKITLQFGSTTIPATLNNTETARAFAAKLPVSIRVNGTGIDFCGKMPFALPYDQGQVHNGWENGDIDYNPGGGWFALLHGGEEDSAVYGDQVTMGAVDCAPSAFDALHGSYDLVIELAE